ncbi:MAG: Alanine transaminase [Candidatus Rifleibacterium amylolyticum]|nr:MAG: Alanine transaminase [Candidatus Rifleibacterium amylolyticum]NLF98502.1 pyridoxal phosphate-dependent aminotransferase [Candidatus Riflebacteria bacterium]
MKKISLRAEEMQASPIRKLIPYAVAARKKGVTVYPLNIGQPDIPTPQPIRDAIRNFDQEVLAYSPSQGEDFLVEAFSGYYRQNRIELAPEDIIVTTGGSEAIFFAFLSICDPGDEIIVFEPFYTNYNGMALETGINLKAITTYAEDGFQLPSVETIEKAVTPKTRGILICNPNNPTGTVYSAKALEDLAFIAKKHKLYVIADEVYREFTYDGLHHTSILQIEGMDQHAILIDSISKRYSACGARIGVVASRNKAVMGACMKFAQARLSSPTVEQWGARAGMLMDPSYFAPILEEYQRRRDTVMAGLAKAPGVVCEVPTGAFYVIAKLPIKNAERFAQWLLTDFTHENSTVLVAPAAGFYVTPGLGFNEIRISYVLEVEKLEKAMTALAVAINQFKKLEESESGKEKAAAANA